MGEVCLGDKNGKEITLTVEKLIQKGPKKYKIRGEN
jgi:hypothetical protein